jgi:hypothetical protein
VQFDTLDFGRDGSCLYTDNRSGAPRNRIVKWDVGSLTSNGGSLVSNAVYATSVNGLSAINGYGIGDADLVYYGESVVTNGGAASVCVLDPATGTESLLLSGVPGRVANVKVAGIGRGELLLFVQCDDGALRVYALNADGRSVGALLKAFTPDEIKTLLGGVTFTAMRSSRSPTTAATPSSPLTARTRFTWWKLAAAQRHGSHARRGMTSLCWLRA